MNPAIRQRKLPLRSIWLLCVGLVAALAPCLTSGQRQVRADDAPQLQTLNLTPSCFGDPINSDEDAPRSATGTLPEGALHRLGTADWRGETVLCFTDSDKTLVTLHDQVVRYRDVASGKELKRVLFKENIREHVTSADGSHFAYLDDQFHLHVFHVTNAKVIGDHKVDSTAIDARCSTVHEVPNRGEIRVSRRCLHLAISSDGKVVAYRQLYPAQSKTRGKIKVTLLDINDNGLSQRAILEVAPPRRQQGGIQFGGTVVSLGARPALSPDGSIVAVITDDDNIHLLDSKTGKELQKFALSNEDGDHHWTPDLLFTVDGKSLVCRRPNGIELIDAKTGKAAIALEDPEVFTSDMTVSPDGKYLFARESSAVHRWDLKTGKRVPQLGNIVPGFDVNADLSYDHADYYYGNLPPYTGGMPGLVCSSDGKLLAAGGSPFSLWHLQTSKDLLSDAGHQLPIVACAFNQNGSRAITVGKDFTVRTWDVQSGKQQSSFSLPITTVRVSLDAYGSWLATGSMDGKVQIWEVAKGRAVKTLQGPKHPVEGLSITPNGKFVAAGFGDTGKSWSLDDPEQSREFTLTDPDLPGEDEREIGALNWMPGLSARSQLLLHPDGRQAYFTATKQTKRIHTISGLEFHAIANVPDTGARHSSLSSTASPNDLQLLLKRTFSMDGKLFACQEGFNTIAIYETASRRVRLKVLINHMDENAMRQADYRPAPSFNAIAFARDGSRIAVSTKDGAIHMIDTHTGKLIGRVQGHLAPVSALAFSDDNKMLLSAGRDTTALIWDLSKAQPR